jgi:tetratricopeptide (TPR) repeat protein
MLIRGLLIAVIVTSLAYLALGPVGPPDTIPPATGPSAPPASGPPAARYEQVADGARLAHLDLPALQRWCRDNDLPDPPALPTAEAAVADTLLEALERAARAPSAENLGHLGRVYASLDARAGAEACFARAAAADPDEFRWVYHQAIMVQETGRTAEAIPLLERAVTLDPDYPTTYGRLGHLCLELDRDAQAERHLLDYIERAPDDSLGYVGRAHTAAATRHMEISRQLPQGQWFALRDPIETEVYSLTDSAHALMREFERLRGTSDWPRLAELAEGVIARRADDVLMMSNLAEIYRRQGRYDEALALLERARALAPDMPGLDVKRGALQLSLEQGGPALDAAERALAHDPEDAQAWSIKGRALWLLEQRDESEAAMRRSLELAPDEPSNLLMLAFVLESRGAADEAAERYRRVLQLVPGQPAATQALERLGR